MKQKTLKKEVVFHGKGLFTAADVVVRLVPTAPGTGIVFRRTDHPVPEPVAAHLDQITEATRCTKIGAGEHAIQTVEHFLAAVRAYEIDNLEVNVAGPEMPIFDGSSLPFIELLEKVGTIEQEASKEIYTLTEPLHWSHNDMHIVALPSDEYRISYTLHYPQSPYLKSQYYSFVMTPSAFREQIAPCRTFTLYQDVAPLIEKGILKNAALEHGVVIDGEKVLNPEGVRFPDEMVRHKILDLIGDFALTGCSFNAHLIAIKSGHAANHAFAKQLVKYLKRSS